MQIHSWQNMVRGMCDQHQPTVATKKEEEKSATVQTTVCLVKEEELSKENY